MSNNFTRFEVRKGVPEILAAFWKGTTKPNYINNYRGMDFTVDGAKDLYAHLRLKDFFISELESANKDENTTGQPKVNSGGIRTIHKDTKIVIDLFVIPQSDFDQVYDIEDLLEVKTHIGDSVLPCGAITIDLSDLKEIKDINNLKASKVSVVTNFGGKVIEEEHSDVDLSISKTGGNGSVPVYNLAIKVPFTPDQLEYLSGKNENKDKKGNFITKDDVKVISWAWINNTTTHKQYSDIFGLDLNNTEDRQAFLLNPFDKAAVKKDADSVKRSNIPGIANVAISGVKAIWNAIPKTEKFEEKVESSISEYVNENIGEIQESRYEYNQEHKDESPENNNDGGEDISPDAFPFDEPFVNFLFFRRKSAFKNLSLGTQFGHIGLINQSDDNIQCMGKSNWPGNYNPVKIPKQNLFSIGPHELCVRGEKRFFYTPDSATHWLNSIEEKFKGDIDYGAGFPIKQKTIGNDKFTFDSKSGTVIGKFHNFLKFYEYDGTDSVMFGTGYLKANSEIELTKDGKKIYHYALNRFNTISVSEGPIIKLDDGKWPKRTPKDKEVGAMCKGFPTHNGQGRFTGTASTLVNLKEEGTSQWKKWKAFSIAHKPIMLYYTLDRDLSEDEIKLYKDDPLTLYIDCYNRDYGSHNYIHTIDFDIASASKKGSHIVLMYPVFHSDHFYLEKSTNHKISLGKGNKLLKLINRRLGKYHVTDATGWSRFRPIDRITSVKSFTTYSPNKNGLFQDNPVITVEDFIPQKVKDDISKKAYDDYRHTVAKESTKFLLNLIPGWGDVLATAADVGFSFMKDMKWSGKSNLELGNKILNCFMDDYLQLERGAPFEVNLFKQEFGEDWNKIKPCVGATVAAIGLIATISKAKADLEEKMILTHNPFLKGQKFGESQSIFDSVYLLAVSEKQRAVKNGKFVYKGTKESAMFFFNRKVDFLTTETGFKAFNHQFTPTGGFLERDDSNKDADEPLGGYLNDFFDKLSNFKQSFSKELSQINPEKKETTSGDFVKLIKTKDIFQKIFKNNYANPKIVEFAGKDDIPRLVDKFIVSKKPFTDDNDSVKMQTFSLIINYMNTLFPRCPACGQPVSLSWGWCPNHATSVDLGEMGVKNKEGFMDLLLLAKDNLKGQNLSNNPRLIEILESELEKNNNRLLVHWTEFDILK